LRRNRIRAWRVAAQLQHGIRLYQQAKMDDALTVFSASCGCPRSRRAAPSIVATAAVATSAAQRVARQRRRR
jgi:hypothetical protein